MVPKQRQPGQKGGGGRIGQTPNRVRSSNRGGRPHAGGGGTGKKPPGKSSSSARGPVAGIVYSIAAGVVLTVASVAGYLLHGYGVI